MPQNNNSKNNGRGPPPWAGRTVERDGDTVAVGKSPGEDARERAESDDQMDRIEAKLDLLLAEMEGSP